MCDCVDDKRRTEAGRKQQHRSVDPHSARGHGPAARQLLPVSGSLTAGVMSDRRQRARVQGSWARQVPRPRGGGPAGRCSLTSHQPFTPLLSWHADITSCFQWAWPPIISRLRAVWPPSLLCGSPGIRRHPRPLSSSHRRR